MTLLKSEIELLWNRLGAFGSVEKIRKVIQMDVNSKDQVLKILAESDPRRLYNLLNGDEFELDITAWAPEFTYEQYVNEYELESNELDESNWDVEEKSIERAQEDGFWLETGTCLINEPKGVELRFEFSLTDGEPDEILATPYDKNVYELPNCFPFSY